MNTNIIANPFATEGDELERYALEECVKRQRLDHRVSALVLPDQRCELAPKLARLGAEVLVVDSPENRQETEGRILASGQRGEITFYPSHLPDLPELLQGEPFDIIIWRRGLCSMPYPEASRIARQLLRRLRIGGKLFISVLGLHSELGEGYPDAEQPIDQRFTTLAPPIAKKYGIRQPVCLYTERNLFMLLLEIGASVLRTQTTTYGNVKAIAVRV
jgi:hypothetical protein